jgi:hypothetical protein
VALPEDLKSSVSTRPEQPAALARSITGLKNHGRIK